MAIKINFNNSFSNLPNKFYSKIVPEKTKKPDLIILNKLPDGSAYNPALNTLQIEKKRKRMYL